MATNNLLSLKKLSKSFYKDKEKTTISIYDIKDENYTMGVIINYILDLKIYEVYSFIEDSKVTVSCLNNKLIKNRILATIYYNYLVDRINKKKSKFFFKN